MCSFNMTNLCENDKNISMISWLAKKILDQ